MTDNKQLSNRRVKKVVIYLSEEIDRDLLDHFAKFARDKRVSDEGRRLWYKALALEGMKK